MAVWGLQAARDFEWTQFSFPGKCPFLCEPTVSRKNVPTFSSLIELEKTYGHNSENWMLFFYYQSLGSDIPSSWQTLLRIL